MPRRRRPGSRRARCPRTPCGTSWRARASPRGRRRERGMSEAARTAVLGDGAPAGTAPLVAVGRIVRAQGLRGEVRIEPLTDAPERLRDLRECWLVPPAAGERHDVESVWFQGRVPVLKLSGSATMT